MRILILILAWVTPALIAEMFGWGSSWGGGSAFADYIIPIPVAGGVMHVPTFLVLALVVFSNSREAEPGSSYLPLVAICIAAAGLTAMLDFERLNSWLFTDYTPYGSPFRLDENPLFLFVVTDALWAGIYLNAIGKASPARSWFVLPLVPLVVIAGVALAYRTGDPVFKIGPVFPGSARGEETWMIYTPVPYDEVAFLNWLEKSSLSRPWANANTEHVAMLFTNSLQAMKYSWKEDTKTGNEHIVATICLYEEDQSVVPYAGSYDCFAGHETATEALARLTTEESTGLGRDIDSWYAMALMCDDVTIPDTPSTEIARAGMCQGMHNVYPKRLQSFIAKYGEDSPQVRFVRTEATARKLAMP